MSSKAILRMVLAVLFLSIVGACGALPENLQSGQDEKEDSPSQSEGPDVDNPDPEPPVKHAGEPDKIVDLDEIKGSIDLPAVSRALDVNNEFPFVGVVTYAGALRCSGTLIEHGLFVTAKHCFKSIPSAADLRKIGLGFPFDGMLDGNDIQVDGEGIAELFHDGPGNDLAYIRYDSSLTDGKVALPSFPIVKVVPEVGTQLVVVGFPSQSDRKLRKVVTSNCQVLNRSGILGPKPRDEGYDGKLFDSDCGAWFGNSGGPFFTVSSNEDGTRTLESFVGVVTHTFDVDLLGSILPEFTLKDSFGSYVRTVNFSPFAQTNVDFLLY